MTEQPNLWQRWERYRPSKTLWFWSSVGCVVATLAVGFTSGGWVTSRTAAQMAKTSADDARNELAAAICVNRFESSPDASAQLQQLKKTALWDRDYFIQKGGWVTLPGIKEPVVGASDLCAQRLMTAVIPPAKAPGSSG
jgi:hypothetical protein